MSINWIDGSILFVGRILERANILLSQYLSGRVKADEALTEFHQLKKETSLYREQIISYNGKIRSKSWKYIIRNENTPSKSNGLGLKKYPNFKDDKFDYFVMRLHKKDRVKKGNQVYFRYSRLSSRKMLECYGMAIEGNKYEHLWVHIDLLQYLKSYPDILKEMKERKLSHKQKFKLKRREFSMEIMFFCRLINW
jgi:hypothetical protein